MAYTTLTATCLRGFEDILETEIKALPNVRNIKKDHQAIVFQTNEPQITMIHANLRLRTAISILEPIAQFRAESANELYDRIYEIKWQNYLNQNQTLAIQSVTNSRLFTHSHFISLKAKDAIVDRFRDNTGGRPSVDIENPDLRLHLRIDHRNQCTISRNSSGQPLFKRGYRTRTTKAPLNEVLAAGLVLLTGWQPIEPLIDPMAGSGTIPIEAALIALNIAPGLFREQFGFMDWHDFDEFSFQEIRNQLLTEANQSIDKTKSLPIFASDSSPIATDIMAENIGQAGLKQKITIQTLPFDQLKPPTESGIMIMNPPYGERIKKQDIDSFYSMIGDTLKKNFIGYTAWIFSGNPEALKHIKLASQKRISLQNGPIDCMYQSYQIYAGSKTV
ncbi:MAG: class I SAM-dependent RNA methyltransferase [Leptonema sp. (in: Bacteria)]|nr:class I SAM-dependent RNA methyltransferase [Leptonema sp. (in: bacteria)]